MERDQKALVDNADLYNHAVDLVARERPQLVGPLDDEATLADLPDNDLDFWDRVEATYRALKRGLS